MARENERLMMRYRLKSDHSVECEAELVHDSNAIQDWPPTPARWYAARMMGHKLSMPVEVFQRLWEPVPASQKPKSPITSICRRCHKSGPAEEEFTSPYTGLCFECSRAEPPSDGHPGEHDGSSEQCGSCRFWRVYDHSKDDPPGYRTGACRRVPEPQPMKSDIDWCGKFEEI